MEAEPNSQMTGVSSSSPIQEQLRFWAYALADHDKTTNGLCLEAADEIDHLRRIIDEALEMLHRTELETAVIDKLMEAKTGAGGV